MKATKSFTLNIAPKGQPDHVITVNLNICLHVIQADGDVDLIESDSEELFDRLSESER